MIIALLVSKSFDAAPAESEYRSTGAWTPYDGMNPGTSVQEEYLALAFMPTTETPNDGAFEIAGAEGAAPIHYSEEDAKVVEIAARALRDDVERVTGLSPKASSEIPSTSTAILVGTLGKSPLIDELVESGKIDVSAIEGKWEAYTAAVVDDPLPGLRQGLVIVGSDRRGTAFGIFGLSESIGVSPWYFWGDVPVKQKSALYITGSHTQSSPGVKYRGIFINDEDWGFQPWAAKTFEPDVGNIGPKTYATVFELLLRLHANMIWPAMHEFPVESTPFYKNPDNKIVADNYAIVISTSHHEPMLTNSHEYDEAVHGPYNYWSNRDSIYNFWEERVAETASYENIYTIGMRGRTDAGMLAPEGTTDEGKAAKIQNTIIPDQRQMIADHVHSEPSEIPQIFIPYKETLVQYQSGLELPDDVTIVWPDDNHGYIRQLSTDIENQRSGGSGVYYHLQYWGVPKSYLWLHSTPLGMTQSEMMKAWDFDANKIWIVNVGDIKPYEIGTDFFLRLARHPEAFRDFDQHLYFTQWAERTFDPAHADAIAEVLREYFRLNIVKRPEHLDRRKSGFSLVSNGDEAQQRLDRFADMTRAANAIYTQLPEAQKPAFYEMVLYPVRASNLANHRVLLAERSRLWAEQNRAATAELAAEVRDVQDELLAETQFYNEVNAGGKWNHMFSPMPTSELPDWAYETQNAWNMPDVGSYTPPASAQLGVAIEGSTKPLDAGTAGTLPVFNRPADSRYLIDVFNQGAKEMSWRAQVSAPWIELERTSGTGDARILVGIDWSKAPYGRAVPGSISITGAGAKRTVELEVFNPEGLDLAALPNAVEDNGTVIIEAEDFEERHDLANGTGWRNVDEAAASGDAMTVKPVTAPSVEAGELDSASPSLSYRFHAFSTGPVEIRTQALPTHRLTSDHPGLRYAISLNDGAPEIVDINAVEYSDTWNINTLRAAAVGVSEHEIDTPGLQTIRIWMVDAGVVLDKLTVNIDP
ncbi:glycosyl hydrolase family 115 (putative glucuronidase) [Marinimicrobium koreense]|uniref:Glycosyl hydrolase family 115 (Putative glucuronidase) n=1 Tax=Marinimicrobium koreense TaxID=306545 RepID=A0A3N1NQI6_9GAMM|nr:glycosyl hydrolase 115 family protein [Marinimicrobium koreense]ROQ18413.1 glycosyl hydrolase family 115 (putative glucuronidase) [Marinimicrobium koreense]